MANSLVGPWQPFLNGRARVLLPARYVPGTAEADEHERALAFTKSITAEHHARYGMAQGCRHTSGFWRPRT